MAPHFTISLHGGQSIADHVIVSEASVILSVSDESIMFFNHLLLVLLVHLNRQEQV
jgi:hypothetical protein